MIISIDPGMRGAIAWLSPEGALIQVKDLPVVDKMVNPSLLYDMLANSPAQVTTALVERQQYMPPVMQGRQQGGASTFKTGVGYGIILGVVASLRVPVMTPTSSTWKKPLGLTKDKERSRKLAIDTWPGQSEWFKRKMDEGRAEAALLGYGYLRALGKASVIPSDQAHQGQSNRTLTPSRRVVRRAMHTGVSPNT